MAPKGALRFNGSDMNTSAQIGRSPLLTDVPRKADSETILAVGVATAAWRCAEELVATRGATHTVLIVLRMASM
eukprot:6701364-Pyramimonas_sp.AAC.2